VPLSDNSVLLAHATAFEFASARAIHAMRRFGDHDGPADLREHIEWAERAPPTYMAVDGQRLALAYADSACEPPPTLLITSDNPWPDNLPTKARNLTPSATMHKLAKKGVRRFFVNNVLRRVVAGAALDVRLYPRAALRAPGGWRYALNGTETRRWSDRRELFLCECIGYMDRGDRSKMLDKLAAAGFERCARRGRCEPLAGGVGNGVGTGRFAKRGWKVVGTLVDMATTAKFALSPPGFGEACHREWEYLIMGAVPVIQRLKTPRGAALQADLYDGLPALIVDDLAALTPATLAAAAARFEREDDFDLAKAYWPYWLAELTELAYEADETAFEPHVKHGHDSGGRILNASSCRANGPV